MSGEDLHPGVQPRAVVRPRRRIRRGVMRAFRRVALVGVFGGTFALLVAWVVFLVYGGIWVWQQLPLV